MNSEDTYSITISNKDRVVAKTAAIIEVLNTAIAALDPLDDYSLDPHGVHDEWLTVDVHAGQYDDHIADVHMFADTLAIAFLQQQRDSIQPVLDRLASRSLRLVRMQSGASWIGTPINGDHEVGGGRTE